MTATFDYLAEAQNAYTDLLNAGAAVTLTRATAASLDLATDTVTGGTSTATTAGVLLPPRSGWDAAYAAGTLTRERHVRVVLASVDSAGVLLTLTPQAGDVVTLGSQTVTLRIVPPVQPDGVTAILYDCEAER